jgi:hypothetical protein
MAEFPQAEEVWLKKKKKITPKFHEHIALSKLKKEPCKAGDEVIGYDVVATVPEGTVIVTDQSTVHFD